MENTVNLAISNKKLNCDDVAAFLYQIKIQSSVTSNKSIICSKNKYYMENGCNITLSDMTTDKIENVWNSVQKNFDLKCAHLSTINFKGCIHDFINKTKCPH